MHIQNTAAAELLIQEPILGRAGAAVEITLGHLTEPACLHGLLQVFITRPKTETLSDHKLPAAAGCRFRHLPRLRRSSAHRFLAENVVPAFQQRTGHLGMQVSRDAEINDIQLFICNHFLQVIIEIVRRQIIYFAGRAHIPVRFAFLKLFDSQITNRA
ncbi:hypothetical protein D3C80_1509540 [compost metagenome]